jgi:putative hemolysin
MVLSCLFALASYSLRFYRRVHLEVKLNGPAGRKRTGSLARQLRSLRLTASFYRAFANLVLVVALVYLFDAPHRGYGRLLAALGVAAAIVAVFGVAIPHAWAAHAGDRTLIVMFRLLRGLRYALYPVSALMEAFDLPIRRLAGVHDSRDDDSNAVKQEIIQAATNGQAEGAVDAEEVEMIESVIKFGNRTAAEIMTPRTDCFALAAGVPWKEAVEKIVAAGHTRVPIYEANIDNIIGVINAKDLLKCIGQANPPPLRSIMRKCYFVPETKPIDDLLKELKARKVHLAVVLDEYGGTAGLVTIEDVIEEIVGDISDEYDATPTALMKRLDENSAEVDGRIHIDDLNDAMKLRIPEHDGYDTVAGLVFSELGYVPGAEEKVEAHGARFTILAADERRITRLRVDKLKTERGEEQA